MKRIISTIVAFFTMSVYSYADMGKVLDAATGVDEVSGGYTFAVVLLAGALTMSTLAIAYLYKRNQTLNDYIKEVSIETSKAMGGVEGVLSSVKDVQTKITFDLEIIKEKLTEININTRQ